jgi:hypothetical protein
MLRALSFTAALLLTACASTAHPPAATGGESGEETGGATGTGGSTGGKGGSSSGGSGGTIRDAAGAPAEPDAAITGTPDARAGDTAAVKPPDSGGGGTTPPGEKHVVVLIGAAANPASSTNSMMAILAAMKDSDGIIAEKGVDATTTAATVANKALVIIGPNSEAYMGKVSPTLKDSTVPILISKDHLGPTLASAATFDDHTANDQHDLTILDAAHPLAAGLPIGDVHVYVPGNRVIYGVQLGPDAIKIATVKGHAD